MADQFTSNKQDFARADQLICPLCEGPLIVSQRQLACPEKHSFDIAKQGYVNLLPVQHKRSKAPGDDKAMVLARQSFLNAGYYQPLAKKLSDLLIRFSENLNTEGPQANSHFRLLDAGCGEGYYLNHIIEEMKAHQQQAQGDNASDAAYYGIDISKPAIIEAAKRRKDVVTKKPPGI